MPNTISHNGVVVCHATKTNVLWKKACGLWLEKLRYFKNSSVAQGHHLWCKSWCDNTWGHRQVECYNPSNGPALTLRKCS